MTDEEVRKNVAESIRALAEQVIENAEEYAVGMEWAQSMKIIMEFNIDRVPKIKVKKNIVGINVVRDSRCRIWTRHAEQNE